MTRKRKPQRKQYVQAASKRDLSQVKGGWIHCVEISCVDEDGFIEEPERWEG